MRSLAVLVLLIGSPAFAHFKLVSPAANFQQDNNGSPQTNQKAMVQLPAGYRCTNCVLQVTEFMSAHAAPCFYHHCAIVTISDDPTNPPAGDSTMPVEEGGCCSTSRGSGASSLLVLVVGALLLRRRRVIG